MGRGGPLVWRAERGRPSMLRPRRVLYQRRPSPSSCAWPRELLLPSSSSSFPLLASAGSKHAPRSPVLRPACRREGAGASRGPSCSPSSSSLAPATVSTARAGLVLLFLPAPSRPSLAGLPPSPPPSVAAGLLAAAAADASLSLPARGCWKVWDLRPRWRHSGARYLRWIWRPDSRPQRLRARYRAPLRRFGSVCGTQVPDTEPRCGAALE